jgi:hypothetical protein
LSGIAPFLDWVYGGARSQLGDHDGQKAIFRDIEFSLTSGRSKRLLACQKIPLKTEYLRK